jgi:hypothetical protein
MKKLILIALAFISVQAFAQDMRKKEHQERKEQLKDLTPDEMATLHSKKLTLHLDLTETQEAKVKTLMLEEAKFKKEKREEREKMKANDDFQKPTKEEHLKMVNEKLDRQIALKQKMKEILNEDQYSKWTETLERKGDRKHEKKEFKKHKN